MSPPPIPSRRIVPSAILAPVLAGALVAGCASGDGSTSPSGLADASGPAVVDVTDGDTFTVRLASGEIERVRIIGVNAPESDECFSVEARDALVGLLASGPLELIADESDRDRFGRLLRYVEVADSDVGERLVERGHAIARRYPPDTARATVYESAQATAEAEAAGVWSPTACGPRPTSPAGKEVGADLVIGAVRFDAAGPDAENLNDEWIRIDNAGDETVDLTGWMVRDESSSNRYRFPDGFALGPGSSVTLHSGCGTDTASDLHWCHSGTAVWNNDGDTAFLLDPAGNVVTSRGPD